MIMILLYGAEAKLEASLSSCCFDAKR